jgi:hypothetical protein
MQGGTDVAGQRKKLHSESSSCNSIGYSRIELLAGRLRCDPITESFLRFGLARKLTALPPFLHRRQNSADGPATCRVFSFSEVLRQLIEKGSVHRFEYTGGTYCLALSAILREEGRRAAIATRRLATRAAFSRSVRKSGRQKKNRLSCRAI